MKAKNIRTQINKALLQSKAESYIYPTEQQYIKEAYARFVSASGKVRNFIETNKYLKARYGDKAIPVTMEEYEQSIIELRETLKARGKYTFNQLQKTVYKQGIETLSEYGVTIKSKISPAELRDILSEAWKASTKDSNGSPTFVEHLQQELDYREIQYKVDDYDEIF